MSVVETDMDSILNQYRVEPESRTTYYGRHIKSFEFPNGEVIPSLTTLLKAVLHSYAPENTSCCFHFEYCQQGHVLIVESNKQAVRDEFLVKRMQQFDVPKYDANDPFRNLVAFIYFNDSHKREAHIFEINEKSVTSLYWELLEAKRQAQFTRYTENKFRGEDEHRGHHRVLSDEDDNFKNDNVEPAISLHIAEQCSTAVERMECGTQIQSEPSAVTDQMQTCRQTTVSTKDFTFRNVNEEEKNKILQMAAMYNILVKNIQLLSQQLHSDPRKALYFSIPSLGKAASLGRMNKYMKMNSNNQLRESQDQTKQMQELIENIKCLIIVVAGLSLHLQTDDFRKAKETVQGFLQNSISLCNKKGISMSVFSKVEEPKFSEETLTFMSENFSDDILAKVRQFGEAWTDAREQHPKEGSYIPSFRGTIAINPEVYRPHLLENMRMSSTSLSANTNTG